MKTAHAHAHTHGRRPHMLLCDTLSLQVSSRGDPVGRGQKKLLGNVANYVPLAHKRDN